MHIRAALPALFATLALSQCTCPGAADFTLACATGADCPPDSTCTASRCVAVAEGEGAPGEGEGAEGEGAEGEGEGGEGEGVAGEGEGEGEGEGIGGEGEGEGAGEGEGEGTVAPVAFSFTPTGIANVNTAVPHAGVVDVLDNCVLDTGVTPVAFTPAGCAVLTGASALSLSTLDANATVVIGVDGFKVRAGKTLSIVGTNALALVVFGDADVEGVIDASATTNSGGPGARSKSVCGGAAGKNAANAGNASGGGGGAFFGNGGDGGVCNGCGGKGGKGAAITGGALETRLGGCPGGNGGNNGSVIGGVGGLGGGVVQLAVAGALTLGAGGVIDAGGAGGLGASGNDAGGGGGGSGGFLRIQAATLVSSSTSRLTANGGAGGGGGGNANGCQDDVVANPGQDGQQSLVAALGGTDFIGDTECGGGNGGNGAASTTTTGAVGSGISSDGTEDSESGGGGGGGAGLIELDAGGCQSTQPAVTTSPTVQCGALPP